MATKFVTNIDLNQNQILNGRLQAFASDPGSGNFEGRLIYNTTEDLIKFYTGSAWRKTFPTLASSTTALTVSEANGTATYSIAAVVAGGASGLITGADKTKLDLQLEQRMQLAQNITSLVLSLRKKEKLRVRQPLRKIMIPILNSKMETKIIF